MPTSFDWNTLQAPREDKKGTSSATQAVLDYVRAAITDGKLEPGQRVLERELSQECAVSRSAIREALRTLEAEGILHREPGHSAIVRQYTLEEVWCHHQIREVLEGLAASLAARRDEVRYHAELVELGKGLAKSAEQKKRDEYLGLNHRLHTLILEMSGNPLIQKHLESAQTAQMRLHSARFWDVEGMKRTLEEHREIIAAILAGDSPAAEAAMRRHIHASRNVFLEAPESVFPSSTRSGKKRSSGVLKNDL